MDSAGFSNDSRKNQKHKKLIKSFYRVNHPFYVTRYIFILNPGGLYVNTKSV